MAPKASKAAVVTEALDEGEVSLAEADEAEETGLSNGLGLEKLLAADPASTKSAADNKAAGDVTEDDEDDKADEQNSAKDDKSEKAVKKETPPKDPKTGRFLPKAAVTSDPPIEDAKADDDKETLKKRLKDTRDWASQVNKKNQELDALTATLKADMEVLKQKLEGTYVESAAPKVDPVEAAKLAERAKISRAIAERFYGPELVQQMIYAENSPYRQLEQADPIVKARVFQAQEPVMEAFKQLKWKGFTDQYGTDPDEIVAKITKDVEAEFVKTLKAKGQGKKTVADVGGLHGASGASDDTKVNVSDAPHDIDLRAVFPGFPTGSF